MQRLFSVSWIHICYDTPVVCYQFFRSICLDGALLYITVIQLLLLAYMLSQIKHDSVCFFFCWQFNDGQESGVH